MWARACFQTEFYSSDLGLHTSTHGLASGAPGHSFITTVYYATILSLVEIHKVSTTGSWLLDVTEVTKAFAAMGAKFKSKPAVLPLIQQTFCGFRFMRWPRSALSKKDTRIAMTRAYLLKPLQIPYAALIA